ncbi:multiple sugar transport system substrate-binding protein/raffinose/stachyose/melibiose transport system substrate-binding protein [Propionicimonas paludicola]|uniref:Multiple sugar transport system substrate-binding protein/raffinose/stachyose/melibiose transport system substrate-binding protein n=2 Tax=Propionicimonas paludicola TaxID=185243 RepID=A0A2A9CQF5_9ACTN|nr:multiple sugar transport system substrate-binding protein/raffinose/stachyose/melibiose transport system substrate-binding protein [Propionicimonas paludicola]
MQWKMKAPALVALGASVALALAGCSGGTSGTATTPGGSSSAPSQSAAAPVTMTFWHNSTTGDGKKYWEDTVAAFTKEHPNVTINIQAIQNEDMDGKLQTALNSGQDPTIFMARGGGKLADVVAAGQVMDITDKIAPDVKTALGDGIFSAFTVGGKIYGMPTSVLPGGIYYSKDLFKEAGITALPTTFEELNAAVAKLKAKGISPIALGGKDAWPAAHWYYFMALRDCSKDVMDKAAAEKDFSDPCWLKAGEDLKAFADTDPFNKGYLTTSAQQGAGSSAGQIANHKAAMELMGAWEPGVVKDLTPDKKSLADLGWFPFPAVSGGAGDPTAMMGGSDGFACRQGAPAECVDFLNFMANKANQEGYAKAFQTLPANKDAKGVVTDPALQDVLASYDKAAYVSLWLDTMYGQNVGNALNGGVVNMLAGKGTAAEIVAAVKTAAAKG